MLDLNLLILLLLKDADIGTTVQGLIAVVIRLTVVLLVTSHQQV
jgi:hypothetical protein